MTSIIPRGDGTSAQGGCSIREAEFFRALSPERLTALGPRLVEKPIERGKVLYFVSEPAEYLWCVARGEVRLYKSSNDGHITTLEVLGPGEVFGALSAIDGDGYPVSAEGVSDGSSWCLPRADFLRLMDEDPGLTREILDIIILRLQSAHERVRSFAHDPAPSRLAQALLRANHDGEAHVTRRDLAEAAGTTVETAIRVLRNFERNGIVRGSVGHITTTDERALKNAAGIPET
jgi:CRP-like cAMP-binding protein